MKVREGIAEKEELMTIAVEKRVDPTLFVHK
jgi:hypothetical protein